MRLPASLRDRLADLLRLLTVLALPLAIFGAAPVAAQPSKDQLEQRLMELVHTFQNDPRYSRGKTAEQVKDSAEFVTGNVLFVLGHEVGHALIFEFGLPVLGREEDAADALAAILGIKMGNSFAHRVVINAARGWFLSDQRDRKDRVALVYYDQHGMDLQRAYNIVCLLVGGNPEKFAGLANEVKLPEERQATCKDDFNNAAWSWEQSLKPHKRKPEDPKAKIEVKYNEPGDYAVLAEHGRKLQILETVADWLTEDFAWKTPISLEMDQCGDPGARWEFRSKRIVVCYELIREFVELYRGYGQNALVPGAMMVSKNRHIVSAGAKQPAGNKQINSKKRGAKAFRSDRAAR